MVHKKELRKKSSVTKEQTMPRLVTARVAPAARACVRVGWWSSSPAIIGWLVYESGTFRGLVQPLSGAPDGHAAAFGCGVVSTNEMSSRVVVGLCVQGVPDNGYRSIGCTRFSAIALLETSSIILVIFGLRVSEISYQVYMCLATVPSTRSSRTGDKAAFFFTYSRLQALSEARPCGIDIISACSRCDQNVTRMCYLYVCPWELQVSGTVLGYLYLRRSTVSREKLPRKNGGGSPPVSRALL